MVKKQKAPNPDSPGAPSSLRPPPPPAAGLQLKTSPCWTKRAQVQHIPVHARICVYIYIYISIYLYLYIHIHIDVPGIFPSHLKLNLSPQILKGRHPQGRWKRANNKQDLEIPSPRPPEGFLEPYGTWPMFITGTLDWSPVDRRHPGPTPKTATVSQEAPTVPKGRLGVLDTPVNRALPGKPVAKTVGDFH